MIRETQSFIDRREEDSVDKNNKRESLIQSKEIDEEEHAVSFYHIETLNELVYWVNKNVVAIKSMLIEIRKENVELNNLYNVIINERTRYEVEYERMKKRVEELEQNRNNDENENVESLDVLVESVRDASVRVDVFVTAIISIVTSKKLSDSLILTDDKNSNIENWLFVMRNKLEENADWFSIKTSKKTYVRTRIDEDAMKHLASRFKKNSIKSFFIAEEIFDNLNRVFDDSNKRVNALKTYRRLKQIKTNKEFHTFFAKFQRLTSDSKIYDEAILLKDLKDKMFWNLQKTLASDIYKTIDLYEFARLCQFIDQTLRDVDNKTRNSNRDDYEESISRVNINNQESSRDQNTSRSRSQTSASSRVINQISIEEQVNAFNCYNCEKFEHLIRNCKASRKFNSNNFVREIEKNVFDNDDQIESRKE